MDEQIKMTYRPEKVASVPTSLGNKPAVSTEQVYQGLLAQFSKDSILAYESAHKGDPFIVVAGEKIVEITKFLRDNSQFEFINLQVISAVDYPGSPAVPAAGEGQTGTPAVPARLEVVYVLSSYSNKSQVMLKAKLPRDNAQIPSICSVYRAANWYERECYDLLGVVFQGHPNLQRILCPQDWVGHALRKDYIFPEEYNGMKVPL